MGRKDRKVLPFLSIVLHQPSDISVMSHFIPLHLLHCYFDDIVFLLSAFVKRHFLWVLIANLDGYANGTGLDLYGASSCPLS